MNLSVQLLSVLITLGLLVTSAHAADAAPPGEQVSLEEYCSANPCRRDVTFQLRTQRDAIKETVPLYWPVVQADRISILPGEKLYIEAKLDGKTLTSFEHVAAIRDPDKTLVFEFTQMDKDLGMTLVIKNPFAKSLKVHIDMMDFSHKPHQTSSCPAVARGSAYESWPHPIPELIISGLRLLDDKGEVSCIY
jgi:hypothetical protein